MRIIKTLIMQHTSVKNGAVGNYWVPSVEVWKIRTGQLNVVTRLFVSKQAYIDGLEPIETKYFKKSVSNWEDKNIENYAFDFIKTQEFFNGAVEDTVDVA